MNIMSVDSHNPLQYMVLMHPGTSDAYLMDGAKIFDSVGEAVEAAKNYDTFDFMVITEVKWRAKSDD